MKREREERHQLRRRHDVPTSRLVDGSDASDDAEAEAVRICDSITLVTPFSDVRKRSC